MDKLKMQTANKADENFKKLAAMFPNAVTETIAENGEVVRAIDKDVLMQEINTKVVDGNEERYQFTWPDKKKSVLLANAPISKTLRPCREESVDFDTTENLYIEGDNLEVLKLLQETYLGKIKMIYIDPPYNTGNDFVYEDDFAQSTDEYLANSGQYDEDGNRMVQNTESNGRFHTDWLNMIYPRLRIAKDLLTDDGVIFISIDDNEVDNLKKICDEIFGECNFIALSTVIVKTEGRRYGGFAKTHEQTVIYAKNIGNVSLNEIEVKGKKFQYQDEFGGFNIQDLRNQNARAFNSNNRPNLRYPFYVDLSFEDKNGFYSVHLTKNENYTEVFPITVNGFDSVWRWGKNEKATKQLSDLVARKGTDGIIRIFQKMRKLTEMPKTVLMDKEYISIKGTRELQDLLGIGVFDFPKPSKLINLFEKIATNDNSIILDFFSGSATTAHAVMQLNAEDGGHRKFIMVQIPEKCDEKSEAYKAGYKTICEIGKERIRRAGAKIKEDLKSKTVTRNGKIAVRRPKDENSIYEEGFDPDIIDNPIIVKTEDTWRTPRDIEEYDKLTQNLDTGFRVLKCDTSNMKNVYYTPSEFGSESLDDLISNIKEDRTPEDLLFQVMLDLGVLLSSKIEETTIAGKKVFNVEGNNLVACFDENVTEEVITAIAKKKPYYFVMRDSSMATDSVGANFEQIFNTYSPETVRKVI